MQTDTSGERCVAFVATSGGLWRHDVSFAGGTDVREGKEAMLKPTEVTDGRTARVARVAHRSEIQSLAMYDPRGVGDLDGAGDVRVASVDSHGRCVFVRQTRRIGLRRDRGGRVERGTDDRPETVARPDRVLVIVNIVLERVSKRVVRPRVGGRGVRQDEPGHRGHRQALRQDDRRVRRERRPDRPTRTMHTLLCPHSVTWVDRTGLGAGGDRARDDKTPGMLAVAEGNQLALYDPRQGEKGGCARRMTLCNRGQPLYAAACGVSQGNAGGGAVALPNLRAGEPLVAAAGAERCVHALNADRCVYYSKP